MLNMILLTLIYWASDLVVALWLGGLLTVKLLFTLPLTVLPEGASPAALAMGATTAISMVNPLRKYAVGVAIVLITAVVLSVLLERQARRSFGWWAIWFIRSSAAVAMVVVSIVSFGDIGSSIGRLEGDISTVQTALLAVDPGDAVATESDRARIGDPARTDAVMRSFANFNAEYTRWMWVEFGLGAIVLLAAAMKQAVWRHSWHGKHQGAPTHALSPELPEPMEAEPIPKESGEERPKGSE